MGLTTSDERNEKFAKNTQTKQTTPQTNLGTDSARQEKIATQAAAAREAQRQSRIRELKNEISVLKDEISKLEDEIKNYTNMNDKIESIKESMKNAKTKVNDAEVALQKSYTSEEAKSQTTKFDNVMIQIDSGVNCLEYITNQSNYKINEKKILIEEKRESLNHLSSILATI